MGDTYTLAQINAAVHKKPACGKHEMALQRRKNVCIYLAKLQGVREKASAEKEKSGTNARKKVVCTWSV